LAKKLLSIYSKDDTVLIDDDEATLGIVDASTEPTSPIEPSK